MTVVNTPTNTTATTVQELLVLTATQCADLAALFMEGRTLKIRRVKGLLRYHKWTVDQVVAAMHEAADRDNVELVVDEKSKSTMKRSMAIVKAWYATGAADLVTAEDDTRDAVFEYLSQIADIPGAALEKYLTPEEYRTDAKVPEWEEVVIPAGFYSDTQPELAIDVNHGAGNGAIAAIVAEYVTHHAKHPDIAAEWLRLYKCAVVYASNERRRAGQDHDSTAASTRVGTGDGSNKAKRGARNQGGTGSKDAPTPAPAAGMPDHRTPGEKPSKDLTVRELIAALHMRVIDPATVITTKDAQEWDSLTLAYEKRMTIERAGGIYVPVPAPVVVAPKPMVTADAVATAKQTAINTAPALPGSKDAMIRAITAELAAQGKTLATATAPEKITAMPTPDRNALMDGILAALAGGATIEQLDGMTFPPANPVTVPENRTAILA